MKLLFDYFMGFFWIFGALCFWPLLRFGAKTDPGRIRGLKFQFSVQVMLLLVTFSMVYHYWAVENQDWPLMLIFPYMVGLLGWVGALIVLGFMAIKRKITR